MRYRVIVSNRARQALKDILKYIAEDSPTASNFVRIALIELIKSLDRSPEKFSREPLLEYRKGNYRSVTKWHYKIIYLVKAKEVIILDIIHTSRNPELIKRVK